MLDAVLAPGAKTASGFHMEASFSDQAVAQDAARGGPIWPGPEEDPTPKELVCPARAAFAACPSAV